jgi:hypothetical protein
VEIRGVKTLGKPTIDSREQIGRSRSVAAIEPEAGKARSRPQLPSFRTLLLSLRQGLAKARLDRSILQTMGVQQEFCAHLV